MTPGNVHDSVAFDAVYDEVTEAFPDVEAIVAVSAYRGLAQVTNWVKLILCYLSNIFTHQYTHPVYTIKTGIFLDCMRIVCRNRHTILICGMVCARMGALSDGEVITWSNAANIWNS